jgi:hypothetical protein
VAIQGKAAGAQANPAGPVIGAGAGTAALRAPDQLIEAGVTVAAAQAAALDGDLPAAHMGPRIVGGEQPTPDPVNSRACWHWPLLSIGVVMPVSRPPAAGPLAHLPAVSSRAGGWLGG